MGEPGTGVDGTQDTATESSSSGAGEAQGASAGSDAESEAETESEAGDTAGATSGDGGDGGDAHLDEALCGSADPTLAGTVVAVGGADFGLIGSTIDGLDWVDQSTDAFGTIDEGHQRNLIRGVGYGAGVFVAVGGHDNSYIATSCDGYTWRRDVLGTNIDGPVDPDYSFFLSDVTYGDGRFVAAGGAGTLLLSEDFGETWRAVGTYLDGHFRGVAHGGGRFVAVGHTWEGDAAMVYGSSDGENWEPLLTTGAGLGVVVEYAAGSFVALGAQRCVVSSDGLVFDECPLPAGDFAGLHTGPGGHWVQYLDGRFAQRDAEGTWGSPTPGWLPSNVAWTGDAWVMTRWEERGVSDGASLDAWQTVAGSDLRDLAAGQVRYGM